VSRVVQKYEQWLTVFPDVQTLAKAPLSDVLSLWLGLGYNRRAKFLHASAKQLAASGVFPGNTKDLVALPGVGVNTAGAILAYAYNQPVVFIETNIRTVFLYHFFEDQQAVLDTELMPLIEQSLDEENPREWYWSLMDYGSYLKQTKGNYSKNSKHHTRQSKFEGSKRQVRGKVLSLLSQNKALTLAQCSDQISDVRLSEVLVDLQKEGFIVEKQGTFSLSE
jgi:A/G-specific adenine glycosylase